LRELRRLRKVKKLTRKSNENTAPEKKKMAQLSQKTRNGEKQMIKPEKCQFCIRKDSADCKHYFEAEKPVSVSDTPRTDDMFCKWLESGIADGVLIRSVGAMEQELAEANRKLVEYIGDEKKYFSELYVKKPVNDALIDELAAKDAEIEKLKHERTIAGIRGHCEMEDKDNEFVLQRNELEAARAEIDQRDRSQGAMLNELKRKDALIEQMLEKLETIRDRDFGLLDEACKLAGVHKFIYLKSDIIELITKAKGGK